jgi:hypothetical protein
MKLNVVKQTLTDVRLRDTAELENCDLAAAYLKFIPSILRTR